MAVLTITITAAGISVADMNEKLSDAKNTATGMNKLENLMAALESRAIPATVAVAVTTGNSVTYDLT